MKAVIFSNENCMVHDDTNLSMFRELNAKEIKQFRKWANIHTATEISSVYCPIVQDELYKIQNNSNRKTLGVCK